MNKVLGHDSPLKTLLDAQGRRREWVARKLGVTPSTVSRWQRGEWPIPDARVQELAELLGVSPDQIVGA